MVIACFAYANIIPIPIKATYIPRINWMQPQYLLIFNRMLLNFANPTTIVTMVNKIHVLINVRDIKGAGRWEVSNSTRHRERSLLALNAAETNTLSVA